MPSQVCRLHISIGSAAQTEFEFIQAFMKNTCLYSRLSPSAIVLGKKSAMSHS